MQAAAPLKAEDLAEAFLNLRAPRPAPRRVARLLQRVPHLFVRRRPRLGAERPAALRALLSGRRAGLLRGLALPGRPRPGDCRVLLCALLLRAVPRGELLEDLDPDGVDALLVLPVGPHGGQVVQVQRGPVRGAGLRRGQRRPATPVQSVPVADRRGSRAELRQRVGAALSGQSLGEAPVVLVRGERHAHGWSVVSLQLRVPEEKREHLAVHRGRRGQVSVVLHVRRCEGVLALRLRRLRLPEVRPLGLWDPGLRRGARVLVQGRRVVRRLRHGHHRRRLKKCLLPAVALDLGVVLRWGDGRAAVRPVRHVAVLDVAGVKVEAVLFRGAADAKRRRRRRPGPAVRVGAPIEQRHLLRGSARLGGAGRSQQVTRSHGLLHSCAPAAATERFRTALPGGGGGAGKSATHSGH